jgi:2-dehydro-3-deoxygalactonokinase
MNHPPDRVRASAASPPVAQAAALGVGLDWGTTNLRAFLLGADGSVIDQREKPWGILSLPAAATAGGFDRALEGVAGDWLDAHPHARLLASGMVGSAQGWLEAPYLDCPVSAADIAARLTPVATAFGRDLQLVPGILLNQPDALPDVIRGEETQVLGALQILGAEAAATTGPTGLADTDTVCFVLPGTHSKWVLVKAARIEQFATYMTGELYATLRQHSILGRLMNGSAPGPAKAGKAAATQAGQGNHEVHSDGASAAAFLQACELARNSRPGDLMRHLFTARSMNLAGRLPVTALADYLSGLLIGHELVSATAWLAEQNAACAPIVLIGESVLLARYRTALAAFGLAVRDLPNTAPAGLHHLLALGAGGSRLASLGY